MIKYQPRRKFSSTQPIIISANPITICRSMRSFQMTTDNAAVSTNPGPAHIAYATPNGKIVSVFEKVQKHAVIPAAKSAVGIIFVKPAENFIICVENTSSTIDNTNSA